MDMKGLIASCFAALLALNAQAQRATPPQGEFAVLSTDRVTVTVDEGARLNCSLVGSEDAAQMNCESHTGRGIPLVYHVALVVGSDHVGYVVSCGGGLVYRIGCKPLSAGQVFKGSIQDGKLKLYVDAKSRSYRIETSAYIGPVRANASAQTANPRDDSATPTVKRAVQTESPERSAPSEQEGQPADSTMSKVMVSSEPTGADIFVDDKFMGNTPSLLQLPAGSHTIRIEGKGQKPWSRDVTLTGGGKVTIQASLSPEQ
jgi:hypothetical protein